MPMMPLTPPYDPHQNHMPLPRSSVQIGDSVIEQTCGAMVCAMRRDASLRARLSPRIAQWQHELGHATLDGPAGASWEAEATGFTLLCWRMNQYNNGTFNSEERSVSHPYPASAQGAPLCDMS